MLDSPAPAGVTPKAVDLQAAEIDKHSPPVLCRAFSSHPFVLNTLPMWVEAIF